jgi:hypothetical protein
MMLMFLFFERKLVAGYTTEKDTEDLLNAEMELALKQTLMKLGIYPCLHTRI